MAKLYFYYSAMNAGKSTILLQSSYNYQERGMNTLVFTPELDTRIGHARVTSRIGLESPATTFSPVDNLLEITRDRHDQQELHCILVDEAQFLTQKQVRQLSDVTDALDIPVLETNQVELFRAAPVCKVDRRKRIERLPRGHSRVVRPDQNAVADCLNPGPVFTVFRNKNQ